MVYLVGAGPGAAGLLTLRGAELVGRADVVMYDGMVSRELLGLAPAWAELIAEASQAGGPVRSEQELSALLVERARAGKTVVRLTGGDTRGPGRGAAAGERLAEAGVAFEVVPGVSALAAADAAGAAVAQGGAPAAKRPLLGQRVVVTRAREQAGQMTRQLQELGAEVLEVPTIRLEPPTRREEVVDALLELNAYDWLVFTSANGVTKFFEYFFKHFHDMRDLGGARLAAIGAATAAKLRELHLQVDLMPEEALGSSVAKAFARFESLDNLRICLLRAEVANAELPRALEDLGAIVDDIACYRTVPETEDPSGAAARLQESGAEWLTFTSASTVEQFHARFPLPELLQKFPRLKTAAIGPETTKALVALGVRPTVEAKVHSMDGLVEAMVGAAERFVART